MARTAESRLNAILYRAALLALLFIGFVSHAKAFARNQITAVKVTQGSNATEEQYLEENHVYIADRVGPIVRVKPSVALMADVLNFVARNGGKIPLYSAGEGAIQVEFGLSGYVGIKYHF